MLYWYTSCLTRLFERERDDAGASAAIFHVCDGEWCCYDWMDLYAHAVNTHTSSSAIMVKYLLNNNTTKKQKKPRFRSK